MLPRALVIPTSFPAKDSGRKASDWSPWVRVRSLADWPEVRHGTMDLAVQSLQEVLLLQGESW